MKNNKYNSVDKEEEEKILEQERMHKENGRGLDSDQDDDENEYN